jgi:hypothetical protein
MGIEHFDISAHHFSKFPLSKFPGIRMESEKWRGSIKPT